MALTSVWTTGWLLLLSLILHHAHAQDISSLPHCGQNCFNVAFNEFSRSCPNRDAACLCSQPGFNPEITSCTGQQCVSTTDNSTTLTFLRSYCGSASQNASATTITPTTVITSSTTSGINSTSPSITITQPYPMSNSTQSSNATVITTIVPTGVTTTLASGRTTGTGTGASTASPSAAPGQNLGVRAGVDTLSLVLASLLLVAFPI